MCSSITSLRLVSELKEQKLARISRIPGAVPQKDIDDTRAELESLIRRRATVQATIRARQELTAPISVPTFPGEGEAAN